MDKITLFYMYLIWIIITIVTIWAVKVLFSKNPFPADKTAPSKIEFVKKNRKKLNFLSR